MFKSEERSNSGQIREALSAGCLPFVNFVRGQGEGVFYVM
jgi:hypothetical protein